MKRLLWILLALMLGGCVAVPYDPYYGAPAPGPVYVVPSASVYYGYGWGGGYYGGWGRGGYWRH